MNMNMIKRGCAALLVASSLLQANNSTAAEPDPGHISFYSKNGSFLCRVKIEEGQTDLYKKEKGCSSPSVNDGFFQLENVRSATTIRLSSNYMGTGNPGCNNAFGYDFTLKTIKNDVVTEKISVHHLRQLDVGMPVVPGLLLTKKFYEQASGPYDTVRCLRIHFE